MSKWKKKKENQQAPAAETPITKPDFDNGVIAEAVPVNNFTVAAEKLEAQGIDPVAPIEPAAVVTRGVLPDAFGNNVKGERICSECGIKESETLAKNPRYSFCKGKCVNCYGKTERKTTKPGEMTVEQIQAKIAYYTDLLAKKNGSQGRVEGNATEGIVIVTDEVTIVKSGANLDVKADALAAVNS